MWYREHRMLGIDGRYHAILAQGVPIRDAAGHIQRWAGINLDISRLKNTERALLEADRRKDEFLATLAHELRNPLAPIRNAVRILDSDAADERQRKWGREVIARQVQRMSLLLDDLLDVSRITRGQLELKKDYVDLKSVVERGGGDGAAAAGRQAATSSSSICPAEQPCGWRRIRCGSRRSSATCSPTPPSTPIPKAASSSHARLRECRADDLHPRQRHRPRPKK